MLAIFKKGMVDIPQELNSPASPHRQPKSCEQIVKEFQQSHHPNKDNAFCLGFGNDGFLSYIPSKPYTQPSQRLFCAMDNMYCLFLGNLYNLSSLIRQYGLSKNTNEAMFAIQAYRTLRDRGPYPADQVLRDLDGSFGFVIYDRNASTVFVAQGQGSGATSVEQQLFWGISADGSAVISDDLNVIKASCAKSYAPFPAGCMFHSEVGLRSFEHPKNKMKAMPRIDSEGAMCGATFKVDVSSKISTGMPRVGSEANWALSGGHHA